MTGEKNKYTTIEKLWKLDDDTLKTPKHDEMVLWLLNRENILSIFNEYADMSLWGSIKGSSEYCKSMTHGMWDLYNNMQQIGPDEIELLTAGISTKYTVGDNIYPYEFNRFIEEYGINLNDYDFRGDSPNSTVYDRMSSSVCLTKELIDSMNVVIKETYINKLHTEWNEILNEQTKSLIFLNKNKTEITTRSEVPITAKNGFLVGYIDIQVHIDSKKYDGKYSERYFNNELNSIKFPITKYIEVKPTIKSFGETLRQLNTYKHYLHTEEMYLFTADLRFKDAFESQGIKVLTYPGLEI